MAASTKSSILPALLVSLLLISSAQAFNPKAMGRKKFISSLLGSLALSAPAWAFSPWVSDATTATQMNGNLDSIKKVAYKSLSINLDTTQVPVACWFPLASATDSTLVDTTPKTSPIYQHRISVRKIGQMLARWDIPKFVCRNFAINPSTNYVVDGSNAPFPTQAAPVVLLAHGYLGSRFDLSHLAETLAEQGFVCIAPEYPESLAASYDPADGIDRLRINQALLQAMKEEWKIPASSYGIVGHSLGCGTAIQTGDENWTRVLISGFPRQRDGRPLNGNLLLLTSLNDGLMGRLAEANAIPSDFAILQEDSIMTMNSLPRRSILVFDRPDAPNHISFLTEGTNDAMIEFLSPLLPVARAFNIPVLDFDRYQVSRDSKATASVVHPIVLKYLQQEMMKAGS